MKLTGGIAPVLIFYILHYSLLLMNIVVNPVDSVHGHQYIRKTAQQRQNVEMDTDLEEELDAEAEEETLDRFIPISNISNSSIPLQIMQKQQDNNMLISHQQQEFDKDAVFEQGETRDFLHFLRKIRYDHRQCPQNEGDPVLISVSVVVSNVRAVSEVTMDYNLEMFYRESWVDERLRYNIRQFRNKTVLALHESYANFLWHPDTFMPNAIASKNPRKQSISHRSLLRLQSDGQILYSRRLSVVAECPMDLTLFPFDSQTCKLGIESYGYTSEQVHYGWSHGQRAALKLHKIRLPDFRIKEAFVTSQIESYATGNYSRLYICFVFSRSAGFCFLQLIIPSTAVVITSWVSLWLESETSFQDMISIILTITFLLFSYNEVMPRVSYLKALDIWLAVCFMIVFFSLIKLAMMKYMRQRLKRETTPNSQDPNTLIAAFAAGMLQNQLNSNWMANGGPFPSPSPFPSARNAKGHNRQQQATSPPVMRQRSAGKKTSETCSPHQIASTISIRRSQMDLHQQQNCLGRLPEKIGIAKQNNLIFQLQQSLLLHQAQLHSLREQRNRERKRRKERERERQQNKQRRSTIFDANQNEINGGNGRRLSPLNSICIGIETDDAIISTDRGQHESSESDTSQFDGMWEQKKRRHGGIFCIDQFGNVEFTTQFMRRFHWISQMSFFFGFVFFCLYFFLVYPNNRSTPIDPACRREESQWFASIPV